MLIPASHAEHTVESLSAGPGRGQTWIYRLLLGGVLGALGSLPFIQVDVSVRAPGMVRPAMERTELRLAVGGRIKQVLARDNDAVAAGQVLLRISTADLDERANRNEARRRERTETIAGLTGLVAVVRSQGGAPDTLLTELRQEWRQYSVQLDSYRLAQEKAAGELARYVTLAAKGIATQQELDNARYEVGRLEAEARLLREQTLSRWQARLREEGTALADLESEKQRLDDEREHYTLRAPAGGALLGFAGWSPGTYIPAGQVLGAISPDATLLVEARVASRDIGQLRPGQAARLQVDAYPYPEWGTLGGIVTAISGDWIASDGTSGPPAFKVVVRPSTLHLVSAGGVRGELKKGLTLSARFLVARRSLLQLLHDDASAWLNPQDQRRAQSSQNLSGNPAGKKQIPT